MRDLDWVKVLPRALRSMADAPNFGARKKSAIPVPSAPLRAGGMTEVRKEKPRGRGEPRPYKGERSSGTRAEAYAT